MRRILVSLIALVATVLGNEGVAQAAPTPVAQTVQGPSPLAPSPQGAGTQGPGVQGPGVQGQGAQGPFGSSITLRLASGSTEPESLGSALEIVLLMTLLSFAPAIVVTMTCFTRIIIVLSFLKRAMSMQDLPPTLVVTGFALFMTIFIMKPVATDIYDDAYAPYVAGQMDWRDATDVAVERMNQFMLRQTRPDDIALILTLSKTPRPSTPEETPFQVTVPAFILSEIKTAFQMGFVLFLPFVIIDLVISSILVSMGMFTLPPVVVSTPLKLLLFILIGGWDLVVSALVESFSQV